MHKSMERWSGEVQATMLHAIFLSRNLDDNSNCKARVISFSNGKTNRGQAAQGLYDITLREEVAKVNELTGTITLARGCRPGSLNPVDSPEYSYLCLQRCSSGGYARPVYR
jgi:hypothetical protein